MSAHDAPTGTDLQQRLARVRLFVMDVDGTLTDGGVVYAGSQEVQRFCVRDGQGLVWVRRAGVALAWISGRGCEATRRRAEELGVEHVHLRCRDKRAALAEVQEAVGCGPDETLAMGDDLPDLALAEGAAVLSAPSGARPEIRRAADLVTDSPAGHGAAREVCEHLLRARGDRQGIEGATGS